ncbi:unnamed protein product [Phaedon cochleariae]|uniref:Endonuclease-reverse transcriptase n=1 Tax=Phaedon cochleariae TaxID=80249 RepID=A0A9P0DII6_PHACE|nr:unnamed protein product [Phaedon cochleariae]
MKSNDEIYALLITLVQSHEDIKHELTQIKNKVSNIQTTVEKLETKVTQIEKENHHLKTRIDWLEKRDKKYSVVLYGLEGPEKDTLSLTVSKIQSLGVDFQKFEIRDAYRIGEKKDGRNRPVVVELLGFQLKTEILNRSRTSDQLKKEGIYITSDYTKQEYQKRKLLHGKLKEIRNTGATAKKSRRGVEVNGIEYTFEEFEKFNLQLLKKIENTGELNKIENKKRKDREEEGPFTQISKSTRSSSKKTTSN